MERVSLSFHLCGKTDKQTDSQTNKQTPLSCRGYNPFGNHKWLPLGNELAFDLSTRCLKILLSISNIIM